LSDDERWQAFEGGLNQQLLRVDGLRPERVRLDRTTASGDWSVPEDGLLQFGHSEDHRPDLPQVKVARSAVDPHHPLGRQWQTGHSVDGDERLEVLTGVMAG
jgi:transposase